MENLTECNLGHGEFNWEEETMVTVIRLANQGNAEAKKELRRREKQLGITSVATLSSNTEESGVFYG